MLWTLPSSMGGGRDFMQISEGGPYNVEQSWGQTSTKRIEKGKNP